MKKVYLLLLIPLIALTGCVTGTRNLENLEVPAYSNDTSASGEVYIASILDGREFEQKPSNPSTPSVKGTLTNKSEAELSTLIGRQRNTYGAAMGDVALPEGITVQDKMRDLIVEGLESRGYQVVEDQNASNQVSIDVSKFWAWSSPGWSSISFESNLHCAIEFEGQSNMQMIEVEGYGIDKGSVASNTNWELAFQRAFEDFLKNMDEAFDEAGL